MFSIHCDLSEYLFLCLQRGEYTEVATLDGLRYQLGSYYNQFSDVGKLNNSIATVPYMDFSGLGESFYLFIFVLSHCVGSCGM